MKVGLFLPQLGEQATKENVVKLAVGAEKEGFDSLWVLERLLWPIDPQVPYPVTPDGSLPVQYKNVLDNINLLTFVAAKTEKILLGTSVVDMLFHTPVILAKRFATLDVLSEGRVICGLGIGWSKDEYETSNIPFERKGDRADEFLEALKRVWTNDIVEFNGEFYTIPKSIIGPKPLQKPYPPLYLGGFTQKTFQRIAKYANGWIGVVAGPLEYLEGAVNMLKEEVKKAGKNPSQFKVLALTSPSITEKSEKRFPLTGTAEEIGQDFQRMKQIGVEHIIFNFNFSPEGRNIDKVLEIGKKLADLAR